MANDITLAPDTIHNPEEPRHFMRLRPLERRVRILIQGRTLADTTDALRLMEVGRDVYHPVIYVPRGDVLAVLSRLDKSSHCPIKGDASYFELSGDVGEIAWAYEDPLPGAEALARRIAFDSTRVTIEESPALDIREPD